MGKAKTFFLERKNIMIRLLYSIFFIFVLGLVKIIIFAIIIFQYIYLLITKKHSNRVRIFSNQALSYAYRIVRYLTLNENQKPFPFQEFPPETENPEDIVLFP